MTLLVSLAGVAVWMAVHLFGYRLDSLLGDFSRSYWLSFAGGVSTSYVFLHIMPELEDDEEVIADAIRHLIGFHHLVVYVVALLGAVIFYGLYRLAERAGEVERSRQAVFDFAFWLSIGTFSLYNVIVAHTIHHRAKIGLDVLAVFVVAMTLHFTINDYHLHRRFLDAYVRFGRWLLVLAILTGWVVGLLINTGEAVFLAMLAFLMGGTILQVFSEEIPARRASSYASFVAGAALYSIVLIAL